MYRDPCASLTALESLFYFPLLIQMLLVLIFILTTLPNSDLKMNCSAPKFPCFVFQSEPCQNGGRCIVTWNDFHCSCPANFTGKFCEEKVWCESDPCPEATTCIDVVAGYVCKFCSPACVWVKSPPLSVYNQYSCNSLCC